MPAPGFGSPAHDRCTPQGSNFKALNLLSFPIIPGDEVDQRRHRGVAAARTADAVGR